MDDLLVLGPNRLWIFVIDTDSYAGNFADDMCAYMTGRVGEPYDPDDDDGVNEMVALYCGDTGADPESEYNLHIVDTQVAGHCLPAYVWFTPDAEVYNSVAIFMDRRPTELEVEAMIARARKYADGVAHPDILGRILGFRLLLRETTESQVASFPAS